MEIWNNNGLLRVPIDRYPASSKTIAGVKWGYIDSKGNIRIKQTFDNAMDFQNNGLAIVRKNELAGAIDQYGHFVILPQYESISQFSEGRAAVIDNKGFRVIDESGKLVTTKHYDYIGGYQEGRSTFAETTVEGHNMYGYLDRDGKEIVPAQYKYASDFQNGKALVQKNDEKYGLIDLNGNVLVTYDYPYVGNLGNGLLAYKETLDGKYGYIDERGRVQIPPTFTGVQPFHDGRAAVNMAEDYKNAYGLINKQGKFIIKPIYNDINLLENNRVAIGKALNKDEPFIGSKYALATTDGTILTDFKFTSILKFENGVASASTAVQSFFIYPTGKIATRLPILAGEGSLFIEGTLIKANIDQRISYYTRSGKVVWQQNTVIPLTNRFKVIEHKYKPNKDYLVYYPQIEGMKSSNSQEKVNQELKQLSQVKPIKTDVQLNNTYTGDFTIEFFKEKLLVFKLEGYDYSLGAAHGMPYRAYPHINLQNGNFYELKDLFKTDSNYVIVLSDIISEQIKNDEQYSYLFPGAYKGVSADQLFYVNEDALYLYFKPYEIAPYVAGFPTFKIRFDEIISIIDIGGEFWRSFH